MNDARDRSEELPRLLNRLAAGDDSALADVEALARMASKECAGAIEWLLTNHDLMNNMAISIGALSILNDVQGVSQTEHWILQNWAAFSERTRDNITAGAFGAGALSTDVVVKLFESSASSVENRHHFVAGLAVTADQRGCQSLVLELSDRIGRFADPARQEVLEEFLAAVDESFASCVPPT